MKGRVMRRNEVFVSLCMLSNVHIIWVTEY